MISFAVTVKLICAFVFAYAKCWFSHEAAHLYHSCCDIAQLHNLDPNFDVENINCMKKKKNICLFWYLRPNTKISLFLSSYIDLFEPSFVIEV